MFLLIRSSYLRKGMINTKLIPATVTTGNATVEMYNVMGKQRQNNSKIIAVS